MSTKILSAVAIIAITFGVVACNQDTNAPAPQSASFEQSALADDEGEFDANEIFDDAEEGELSGARAAAIDTAVAYKLKFKVSSPCVSGTASVGFRYTEGNVTTPVLSGTAINTKAGFKSFSVKRDKLNTELLKTFDKTKTYSVYIMSAAAVKAIKAVKDANGAVITPGVPAVPAQYKYVTTLPANPAATKKLNKAGTKLVGRPITDALTTLDCPPGN